MQQSLLSMNTNRRVIGAAVHPFDRKWEWQSGGAGDGLLLRQLFVR